MTIAYHSAKQSSLGSKIHEGTPLDHSDKGKQSRFWSLDFTWEEKNGLLPLIEKAESFPERIMAGAANILRSDLSYLKSCLGVCKM